MKSPRFNSIEEYLASVDHTKARTLSSVIDFILAQFPELESKIFWNVPTIHRNGKYVVGVCAYKRHLTFAPWSPHVIEYFKARLGKFVVGKNCFQIPVDWEIDRDLVKDLVRARLAELDHEMPKKKMKSINKMIPRPAGEESAVGALTNLRKALAATPKAKARWSDLTPIARRDFISWIDSAKLPETRRRRIEKACSMLATGKRRPCCYSIVSFNLYTALNATPIAKAQWSDLTPLERRDFISWMDSAKESEAHKLRIEKACSMLAAGKRRP